MTPTTNGARTRMDKRGIKRVNCTPCRQRKLKCDRGEPCLSCVLRGTEDLCFVVETRRAVDTPVQSALQARASVTANGQERERRDDDPVKELQRALEGVTRWTREAKETIETRKAWDGRGAGFPTRLGKREADALFPSADDMREICDCFFTDLDVYQSGIDRSTVDRVLAAVQSDEEGEHPAHDFAILCGVLAFGLLFAPRNHSTSRLARKDGDIRLDPRWQIENMRMLLDVYYDFDVHDEEKEHAELSFVSTAKSQEIALEQVCAETLFCYYCSVAGLVRRFRASIGRAIHLGMTISMFDESGWPVDKPLEADRKRRIASDLIVLERWSALHTHRASLLVHTPLLRRPTALTVNNHIQARNALADAASHVLHFFQHTRPFDLDAKVKHAEAVNAKLCRFYDETLPPALRFHLAKAHLTIGNEDVQAVRDAATALLYYLSQLFLRCALMRGFLLNPHVPSHVRFASIGHAQSTLSTLPFLVHLTTTSYVTSPPAWNTHFIYVAATTFATLLLSVEHDKEMNDSRHHFQGSWPKEELDWFTKKLVEVLQTFDIIAQGVHTHTARTCKKLLEGLCTSEETLRKRFQQRQHERHEAALAFRSSQPPRLPVASQLPPTESLFDPIDIQIQGPNLPSSGRAEAEQSFGLPNDELAQWPTPNEVEFNDIIDWAQLTAELG